MRLDITCIITNVTAIVPRVLITILNNHPEAPLVAHVPSISPTVSYVSKSTVCNVRPITTRQEAHVSGVAPNRNTHSTMMGPRHVSTVLNIVMNARAALHPGDGVPPVSTIINYPTLVNASINAKMATISIPPETMRRSAADNVRLTTARNVTSKMTMRLKAALIARVDISCM